MILMLAPSGGMTFGSMPSGATYVSDPYGLVRVLNNSVADQAALQNAGCLTCTTLAIDDPSLVTTNTAQTITAEKTMSGGVTGLPAPTEPSDATNLEYITANAALLTASNTFTGVNAFTQPLTVPTPVAANDAAPKTYVDGVAVGVIWNVLGADYAAVSALPSYTYNNGTAGVGATITATSNGALSSSVIDGGSVTVGKRIFINFENLAGTALVTSGAHAGLYAITQVGDGSDPFILTRVTDADTAAELASMGLLIKGGSTVINYQFVLSLSAGAITVGTTALDFSVFAGPNSVASVQSQVAANTADLSLLNSSFGLVLKNGGSRDPTGMEGLGYGFAGWLGSATVGSGNDVAAGVNVVAIGMDVQLPSGSAAATVRLTVYTRLLGAGTSAPVTGSDTQVYQVSKTLAAAGLVAGGPAARVIWNLPSTFVTPDGYYIIMAVEALDGSSNLVESAVSYTTVVAGLDQLQRGYFRGSPTSVWNEPVNSLQAVSWELYVEVYRETGIPSLIEYAVPTDGVSDCTSDFAKAAAENPQCYVPPGVFQVTALPYGCFYGPGKVYLNGTLIPLAPSASVSGYRKPLRAKLARLIDSASAITLLADSIGEHYGVNTVAENWFELLCKFLNADVAAGSEPEETDLQDALYGFTFTGTWTEGTNGPIAVSSIGATGATLVIPGTFATLNLSYMKSSSGGTITVKRADGTTIQTINTSGSAAEAFSGDFATGGAGPYTLTVSVASIELTGIGRRNAQSGSRKAPYFSRCAFASQATTHFIGSPILASIAAHGLRGGSGKPLFLVALGTNDAYSSTQKTSPTTYQANLETIFTALKATGYVVMIAPYQPNEDIWPPQYSGAVFDDYLAGAIAACEATGVPCIQLDDCDFVGPGLLADGLHPNAAGQTLYLDLVCEGLSRLTLS